MQKICLFANKWTFTKMGIWWINLTKMWLHGALVPTNVFFALDNEFYFGFTVRVLLSLFSHFIVFFFPLLFVFVSLKGLHVIVQEINPVFNKQLFRSLSRTNAKIMPCFWLSYILVLFYFCLFLDFCCCQNRFHRLPDTAGIFAKQVLKFPRILHYSLKKITLITNEWCCYKLAQFEFHAIFIWQI